MPATFDEWSDLHWDRAFARQTAQSDTIKLLTTFTLALAGALVATALQVAPPQGTLDLWAAISLGIGLLLTFLVIVLDRLKVPSRRVALQRWFDLGLTEPQLLAYLRNASRQAEDDNERQLRRMRRIAELQVLVSGVTGVLATVSLFQPPA